MNVPKAFERALAVTIRANPDYSIGRETVIRCWQNLRNDPMWKETAIGDKTKRTIDIRATPPMNGENETSNFTTTAQIECRTKAEDDKDHAQICGAYTAVQETLDSLYDQYRDGETGDMLDAFKALLTADLGATFGLGNLSFGDASAPWEDEGYNVIAVAFTMDYSR